MGHSAWRLLADGLCSNLASNFKFLFFVLQQIVIFDGLWLILRNCISKRESASTSQTAKMESIARLHMETPISGYVEISFQRMLSNFLDPNHDFQEQILFISRRLSHNS
jgi:hypothetical protein